MGHSRNYAVRLTDRDKALFEYLFITKGATRPQIHRDIFAGASKQVVHERMRKLLKYEFVSGFPVWFEGSKTAYRLTNKALFKSNILGLNPKKIELKSSNPEHDFSLIEIRNCFLKARGLVHYLMENQLQAGIFGEKEFNYDKFIELRSDAFMRIQIGKGEFSGAIEFERVAKSRKRYTNLLFNIYLSKSIAFVFYIVSHSHLRSLIFRLDKEVRQNRDPKIFCVTYQELQNAKRSIVLRNSDNGILDIELQQKGAI